MKKLSDYIVNEGTSYDDELDYWKENEQENLRTGRWLEAIPINRPGSRSNKKCLDFDFKNRHIFVSREPYGNKLDIRWGTSKVSPSMEKVITRILRIAYQEEYDGYEELENNYHTATRIAMLFGL